MRRRFFPVTILANQGVSTYTISGTVYDADGTTAVASATVALGALTATSGVDGTYSIASIPAGTSGSLTCTKTGYSWTAISVSAMSGNLTSQNFRNIWYAGGGSLASATGVYQGIGAATLAASYTNLLTPGTNDLTTAAAPTFATATGWNIDTVAKYLECPLTWQTAYTVIILIADGGATAPSDRCAVIASTLEILRGSGTSHYYRNGSNYLQKTGVIATKSVLAIANTKAYLDGVDEGTITTGALNVTPITFGNNASHDRGMIGKLLAMAVYNTTLTQGQIVQIGAGMQALPNP